MHKKIMHILFLSMQTINLVASSSTQTTQEIPSQQRSPVFYIIPARTVSRSQKSFYKTNPKETQSAPASHYRR